jgi:SHS2 domain-containing protein
MKYRFFEHTADMGVEAEGDSIEEAFSATALGLEDMITDITKVGAEIKKEINVESEDYNSLLYDFLEQFLILFDSEELLFSKVEVKSISESDGKYKLEAIAYGEKFDSEKHESKTHVKAVTYHGMEVKEESGKFHTKVLFDI